MQYHHYAPCNNVPSILAAGRLYPSNAARENERPMLWFSSNQRWENTATKLVQDAYGHIHSLNFKQQHELIGCCRFSIRSDDPRLMPWRKACRNAGTTYSQQKLLEKTGLRLGGNPHEWFAMPDALLLNEATFSVFDGECWVAADINDVAAKWSTLQLTAA